MQLHFAQDLNNFPKFGQEIEEQGKSCWTAVGRMNTVKDTVH